MMQIINPEILIISLALASRCDFQTKPTIRPTGASSTATKYSLGVNSADETAARLERAFPGGRGPFFQKLPAMTALDGFRKNRLAAERAPLLERRRSGASGNRLRLGNRDGFGTLGALDFFFPPAAMRGPLAASCNARKRLEPNPCERP